jgi:hypothetical protein
MYACRYAEERSCNHNFQVRHLRCIDWIASIGNVVKHDFLVCVDFIVRDSERVLSMRFELL